MLSTKPEQYSGADGFEPLRWNIGISVISVTLEQEGAGLKSIQ